MFTWFNKLGMPAKIAMVGAAIFWALVAIGAITNSTNKKETAQVGETSTKTISTSMATTPTVEKAAVPTPPPPPPVTPADRVKTAAALVLEDRLMDSGYDATSGNATVQFQIADNLTTGMMVDGARKNSVEVSKTILAAVPDAKQVLIGVYADATDNYGNTNNKLAIKITLSRGTAEKINISGMDWEKFPSIADSYKELIKF